MRYVHHFLLWCDWEKQFSSRPIRVATLCTCEIHSTHRYMTKQHTSISVSVRVDLIVHNTPLMWQVGDSKKSVPWSCVDRKPIVLVSEVGRQAVLDASHGRFEQWLNLSKLKFMRSWAFNQLKPQCRSRVEIVGTSEAYTSVSRAATGAAHNERRTSKFLDDVKHQKGWLSISISNLWGVGCVLMQGWCRSSCRVITGNGTTNAKLYDNHHLGLNPHNHWRFSRWVKVSLRKYHTFRVVCESDVCFSGYSGRKITWICHIKCLSWTNHHPPLTVTPSHQAMFHHLLCSHIYVKEFSVGTGFYAPMSSKYVFCSGKMCGLHVHNNSAWNVHASDFGPRFTAISSISYGWSQPDTNVKSNIWDTGTWFWVLAV